MSIKLNREELAALEVGQTKISRRLAFCMVLCFVTMIYAVPLVQTTMESLHPESRSVIFFLNDLIFGKKDTKGQQLKSVTPIYQKNNNLLQRMDRFEKDLENESFLRTLLHHLS